MSNSILENFKLYFPSVASRMTSYKRLDDFEIAVQCDDGSTVIFDDMERSIRPLPPKGESWTEELWQREFGRRLRKRMMHKGMTQAELANKIGTSQVMISNYINGRCTPGLYIADKIANALDCSIDDLRYT